MSKTNEAKSQSKKQPKCASIRVSRETQKKLDRVLAHANKKTIGRKIRADQVLNVAIELVADEQIKLLQEQSMTNEDRRELLRQRYIAVRGPISRDGFLGFALSAEFPAFMAEHGSEQSSTV